MTSNWQLVLKMLKPMSFRGHCPLDPRQGPLSGLLDPGRDPRQLHSLHSLRFAYVQEIFNLPCGISE